MKFSKTAALIPIVLVAFLAVPLAQQQPPAQPQPAAQGQPPAPAAPAPGAQQKPYIPLAASTLANKPDAYYGELVTVTATVEQVLSKSAISVDQDQTKSTGKEILVLAPTMNGTVDLNSYVTVIGELMPFDPAEVAKKAKGYTLDISPEIAAKFKGRPVVLATAVVNSAGIDVAKKPIPPPTADDLTLSKVMKQVGPANTALRGDIDKMDVALTKEHAGLLKRMFTETEIFWKAKNKPEPTQLARDAIKDAEALEAAVAANNWDQARTAAGSLGQKCGGCHRTYREAMDDGTFRIKAGF